MTKNQFKVKTIDEAIFLEWYGVIDSIDYRRGHQDFLKVLESQKNTLWLLNYKQSGNIEFEDIEWTINEWLPETIKAIESGVSKIAVVVPENIFNKISIRIITSKIRETNKQVYVSFFNNESEAELWLLPETFTEVIEN